MLADRPNTFATPTKVFLDKIERSLCAAASVTPDADATASDRRSITTPAMPGRLAPAPRWSEKSAA
ncbi:hypothetical protein EBR56_00240 [bacterium]|nr:hypothetical protein [bacterium]